MERWQAYITAGVLGLAIGLGTAWIADAQMRMLSLEVVSLNDSGIAGTATLRERDSSRLEVALQVNGGGEDPLPSHIHEGACADLNPEPKIPLADVRNGASTTELAASLEQLTSTPHVIFAHKSPEELPVFVSCADITDVLGLGQAPTEVRAGSTGSGSLLVSVAIIALAAFSLVLAVAGRGLRRSI
jgi:hypothetical protein